MILSTKNFIIILSLVATCIIISATTAAIFGFFHYFLLVLPIVIVLAAIFVCFSFRSVKDSFLKTRGDWLIVFLILIFAVINGFFYHETVSGARDDGYYALNAVQLAKNGSIFLTEGRYHPPGVRMLDSIHYSLTFPPAYHSYLGIFYAYFGLAGMLFLGNLILLWLSLSLLYFIAKQLAGKTAGIFTVLLFASNYVTLWFSRRTNNENLALFLILLTTMLLLSFLSTKKLSYYFFSTIPLALLVLTRQEGLTLVFSYLLVSLFLFGRIFIKRIKIVASPLSLVGISLFCLIFCSLSVIGVIQYQNLTKDKYIQSAISPLQKEFLEVLDRTKGIILGKINQAGITNQAIKSEPVYRDITTFMTPYALDSLSCYFILQVLVIGLISLAWLRLDALIILVFLSPYFTTLIYPAITADHPWMMRRYWIAVIPAAYILFNLFLFTSKKIPRRGQILIVIAVFIINLVLSSPIINLAEQRGLLKQLKPVAKLADKDTLIVLTGDIRGWNAPLYYYDVNNVDPYGNQSLEIPSAKQFGQEFRDSLKSFKKIYFISEGKTEIAPPLPDSLFIAKDNLTVTLTRLTPGASELIRKSMEGSVTDYSIIQAILPTIPAKEVKTSMIHAYIYQLDKEAYLNLQK